MKITSNQNKHDVFRSASSAARGFPDRIRHRYLLNSRRQKVDTNVSEEYTASIFRTEAVCSSETLVSTYKSTRRWNPEDQHRHKPNKSINVYPNYD
jgi:hypothetical protein